jgi:hypothetical protein
MPSMLGAPVLESRCREGLEQRVEQRHSIREPAALQGRLAYGGLTPRLVGCGILDMSETGVRIEIYGRMENLPEVFTLEICGVYNCARKCWTKGREMGLAFMFDDMQYLDAV